METLQKIAALLILSFCLYISGCVVGVREPGPVAEHYYYSHPYAHPHPYHYRYGNGYIQPKDEQQLRTANEASGK